MLSRRASDTRSDALPGPHRLRLVHEASSSGRHSLTISNDLNTSVKGAVRRRAPSAASATMNTGVRNRTADCQCRRLRLGHVSTEWRSSSISQGPKAQAPASSAHSSAGGDTAETQEGAGGVAQHARRRRPVADRRLTGWPIRIATPTCLPSRPRMVEGELSS
jgi:hypothetical protein